MADLSVNFAGIALRNPVVLASAPPTESVEGILRAAEAGAAAAIIKTMADFDAPSFPLGARRAGKAGRGLWALSTFRRETLTLEDGCQLIERATQAAGIPIIASIGALSTEDVASWVTPSLAAQKAGAAAIQLDLFYLPQPRCAPDQIRSLKTLLGALADTISIPVVPKLNIDLPAHYAAEVLNGSPIAGIAYLDSVRTPPPLTKGAQVSFDTPYVREARECSLFGPWQKPLTLQYTSILSSLTRHDLLAGGGLMDGRDTVEAILLGATAVQFATAIITRGYKQIRKILDQLNRLTDEKGFASVAQMRGAALVGTSPRDDQSEFADAIAVVDHGKCIDCGICTDQTFCESIELRAGKVWVAPNCDGCGLCVSMCPKPGALVLKPNSVPA